jgi:hypothetical protein
MESFMAVSWGSPIGIGLLLMGLGVFFWGLSKAGWTQDK